MIIELRAKNCFSFKEQIIFSMKADMRNKRLASNVHNINNFNILKTAGVYGPNNSGKTCLAKCFSAIKSILLNQKPNLIPNLFSGSPICELGITFLSDGKKYSYDLHYDTLKEVFIYEKFAEIIKDQYGNNKEEIWLEKDMLEPKYKAIDKGIEDMIPLMSSSNLLCYVIDASKFEYLNTMKKIIIEFAQKLDILNMNNIPMKKTIELMKNKNDSQRKVVDFIKNADLYLDNYEYVDAEQIKLNESLLNEKPDEEVLNVKEKLIEQLRLVSTYKGVKVPSMIFDSTGTKKIAALASYIIEGLEMGKILIIDELDSSIHFKITRAIVAMFNNELNTNAQMIFMVHDINLMDCKRLLRKEQIWFIHKDQECVYVYSLAEFTANDGIRDTTDVIEKYRKGALGALPDPELIYSLLSLKEK